MENELESEGFGQGENYRVSSGIAFLRTQHRVSDSMAYRDIGDIYTVNTPAES